MNTLMDEIRAYQKQQWYRHKILGTMPQKYSNPTGVQLEITYKCNLNCKHCYNESGEPSKLKFQDEMSEEKWLNIAQELVDSEIFAVIISGGEPFLNIPFLMKLVDIFDNADVRMGIISNGWFLDEKVVSSLVKFQKNINWIQISLDGANSQVHDKIRGVKGSFERAVKAIINLRKFGFYTKMATAVMHENMHQLEEFFELALFLGVNAIHLGIVFDIGTARNINIDNKLKEDIIQNITEKKELYSDCMDVLISMDPNLSVQLFCKYRQNNVYIIRPNGELKLDCAVPVIFGRYKERGDLKKLWKESGLDSAFDNDTVKEMITKIEHEQSFSDIFDTHIKKSSTKLREHMEKEVF